MLHVTEVCSFSLLSHVSSCAYTLIDLSVLLLMGTKVFGAIRIVLLLTFLYKSSGEHMGTFLLGLCPRVEIRARGYIHVQNE